MKIYMSFLMALLSVFSLAEASSVISRLIPNNTDLRDAISDYLNKSPGNITENDLLNLNELVIENKGLKSLNGIETLQALEALYASNNNIEDITPLESLMSLTSVSLNNNNINLTDFKQLTIINNLVQREINIEINHQAYTPIETSKYLWGSQSSRFEILYGTDGKKHLRIGGKPFAEVASNINLKIKSKTKQIPKKIYNKVKDTLKVKDRLKKWKKKW